MSTVPKEPTELVMDKIIGKHASFFILDDVMEKPKAKFAPVAPIHIYEALANRGYVPQNILLLAHDVFKVENRDRYMALFNRGPWKDTHIIMDNSLIEVGNAISLDEIEEAVRSVNADVVVLPDSLTDGLESAKLTVQAWDEWKTRFSHPYRGDKQIQLMAVIQGETQRGFFGALEYLAKEIDPDWISIPRRTESKFGYTRERLIDFVQMFWPEKPIHLLGFSEFPWEDIAAAQHSAVRSIDSAAPLRSPMPFSDPGAPRVNKETGADWWDNCKYSQEMLHNINKVDMLINGTYGEA